SISDYQQKLVEKERLAAAGEMTTAVAHNLRNPLASVRALAQTTQRDPEVDESVRTSMATIMSTVDRADRWLKELLMVLRPVKVSRSLADLNEILRELADVSTIYADRRQVSIELELAEDLPEVPVDRSKLNQALISLVTNAVDASPPGKTVTLRSERPDDPGRVDIVVEDQGPGMEPEVLRRIFTPFFSTKKSGTGVGLSLTQRIIFGHQGGISADSSPGNGCRMRVSLPVEVRLEKGSNGTDTAS
ncbi:MAG: ATP-binding protein, partial [Planctomycetota bacterium]